jgi:hypothetical protein
LRNNLFALLLLALACIPVPAQAIPLFAQRYRLTCEACHTVLPELNAFGEYFRSHGYRLSIPRHGTTGIALRYQLEYEKEPVNSRRFTPGGVLLSNADIGNIAAFVHYNLGAGGGPSGLYLGYLATYAQRSDTLFRAGLIELPLLQSPGQRLDDLQQYGYYGAHLGLNDLTLASPRWGLQIEQHAGTATFDAVVDDGEFKGAPYGGAPVATGDTTSAARPEIALFARTPLGPNLTAGFDAIDGERAIALTGKSPFDDAYTRDGFFARYDLGKLQLQGEQWWGRDGDSDGFGTALSSSGGYLRLKYYPTDHFYLAARYDAYQNPFITRDMTYYGAFMITPHVRFLLQQVQTIGGTGSFGGALTVGFPWPTNL